MLQCLPYFTILGIGQRSKQLSSFLNQVDRVFECAYAYCCTQREIKINEGREFEWSLTHTGDFALEYTLWIYLERIPNTKVTATIRKHLMGTIYRVNEAVYAASIAESVDLSTPNVARVSLQPGDDQKTQGNSAATQSLPA